MFTRILRFAGRLAALSILVVVLSGVGHLLLHPGTDASSEAGQAVTAVTHGTSPSDVAPPGFEEEMGYLPDATGKAEGSCSVPGGVAYPGFTGACCTHDLGYDLLRFADESGEPLGPWARLAIDRHFHHDMIQACDTLGCRLLAHVYGFAVGLNSVRQGFTAPTEEPVGPWAMAGVLVVATASVPIYTPTPPRKRRQVPVPA